MNGLTGGGDAQGRPLDDSRQAPGLARRMACFVYEGMILFGIGLIPGAVGALFEALTGHRHPLQGDAALRGLAFLIYGMYFTWFWSARGQTLPMQTWHIRVVTAQGQPLSQPRAALRYFASCAWFAPAALASHFDGLAGWSSLAAFAVGVIVYALLALLHPKRQFWHDALCRTQLVDSRTERRTGAGWRSESSPARSS